MLKTLGRSVYLTQFEEQRASLSAFAAGGAPVFISLHISEEFDAAYCARVQEMCDFLSAQGWRILADVSGAFWQTCRKRRSGSSAVPT